MKLRNKKTGEIHEITEVVPLHDMDKKFVIYSKTEGHNHVYKNLAELNSEWEDYEEPKDYWYIYVDGDIYKDIQNDVRKDDGCKEIGNYFNTPEEAEKAVEKLKAAKRLKDKGIKAFSSEICGDDFVVNFKLTNHIDYTQSIDDFDLIFDLGGEE